MSSSNKYRIGVTLDPPVWEALVRHVFDLNLKSDKRIVSKTEVVNEIVGRHFGIAEGSDLLLLKAAPQKAGAPRKLRGAKSA